MKKFKLENFTLGLPDVATNLTDAVKRYESENHTELVRWQKKDGVQMKSQSGTLVTCFERMLNKAVSERNKVESERQIRANLNTLFNSMLKDADADEAVKIEVAKTLKAGASLKDLKEVHAKYIGKFELVGADYQTLLADSLINGNNLGAFGMEHYESFVKDVKKRIGYTSGITPQDITELVAYGAERWLGLHGNENANAIESAYLDSMHEQQAENVLEQVMQGAN